MGMGEPLMNYKNLINAIDKITQSEGLGMSPSRITVSTSGIPKMMMKMADDQVRFGLAVSLHSSRQELRQQLMPFAEKFPLNDLVDAIKYWHEKTAKPVTYEYVVWKGINDGDEDINALVDFCKISPCKVNLIEYNPIGDDQFLQADKDRIQAYESALEAERITVTVRRSRGKDIDAACGQLANKAEGE
jgi:23S rRNA (adenine2503-C2)-methyltransferase